jgi:hypothetical protein
MNSRNDRKGPHLDRIHSGAIWNEIGERLRSTAVGKPTPIPPDLLRLVQKLDDFMSRMRPD